jgi:hypothetical protein
MKRFIMMLGAALAAMIVTGCSTSLLMQLNACNCFVLRRGVTPEQFRAAETKARSWFGPRAKPQPESIQKFHLGDDLWEVWVYRFSSAMEIYQGGWGFEANPSGGGGPYLSDESHQEFVAFRNGLLEDWGRGSLPAALKRNGAIAIRANSDSGDDLRDPGVISSLHPLLDQQ